MLQDIFTCKTRRRYSREHASERFTKPAPFHRPRGWESSPPEAPRPQRNPMRRAAILDEGLDWIIHSERKKHCNQIRKFHGFFSGAFHNFCNVSASINDFWHFRTHLWNSDKFSSKFSSKIAAIMSKLRKFEWIEFSFGHFYQNYDDFFAEILRSERCKSMYIL